MADDVHVQAAGGGVPASTTQATNRVTISVDRHGTTGAHQLSINLRYPDGLGHGYRLYGPKFTGNSTPVLDAVLDQRDADEIREYLDAVFPNQDEAPAVDNLTFHAVSDINRARCERWHPGFPNDGWTGADWSNAMQGEAGEAGNVVKKLRRIEFGLNQAAGDQRDDLLAKLATEIGDTFLYLDLLAQHYGLDLARCVADTFNRVSVREGFPERIEVAG